MEQYPTLQAYQDFLQEAGDTQDYVQIGEASYQMGMYDQSGKEVQYYLMMDNNTLNENIGFTVQTSNRYSFNGFHDALVYSWVC